MKCGGLGRRVGKQVCNVLVLISGCWLGFCEGCLVGNVGLGWVRAGTEVEG